MQLWPESVRKNLIAVQLPPREQSKERLRLIDRNGLARLILLVDTMTAITGANFARLEFDPVTFTHNGRAGW